MKDFVLLRIVVTYEPEPFSWLKLMVLLALIALFVSVFIRFLKKRILKKLQSGVGVSTPMYELKDVLLQPELAVGEAAFTLGDLPQRYNMSFAGRVLVFIIIAILVIVPFELYTNPWWVLVDWYGYFFFDWP